MVRSVLSTSRIATLRQLSRWRTRRAVGERVHGRLREARMRGLVQVTTDGQKAYLDAVEDAFGADIDYAQDIRRTLPSVSALTRLR